MVHRDFLHLRKDLLVHGGLRGRDEAGGRLTLCDVFLSGSDVDGEVIVDADYHRVECGVGLLLIWLGLLEE